MTTYPTLKTPPCQVSAPNGAQTEPRQAWKGFTFVDFYTHEPVGSCEEAALARGIELRQELKTLIMKTQTGFVAVHLRADQRLNSKAIKKTLATKRLRFASAEELADFGLELGRVNPGNTDFVETHLVSQCVFEERFLATNDGSFTRGVAFRPRDLLSLNPVKIGGFSNA